MSHNLQHLDSHCEPPRVVLRVLPPSTHGRTVMSKSEYRRMAALCLDLAKVVSLHHDRARLTEMARRWLALAEAAEKQDVATPVTRPAAPVVEQQTQQQGRLKKDEE